MKSNKNKSFQKAPFGQDDGSIVQGAKLDEQDIKILLLQKLKHLDNFDSDPSMQRISVDIMKLLLNHESKKDSDVNVKISIDNLLD